MTRLVSLLFLLLLPTLTSAQQTLTVPCLIARADGRVLFGNETLPVLPERQRWTLVRYEPNGDDGTAPWQRGECTVRQEMRH